ncbi:discoidin, CUB and LCCL domain-containing protein 1 [Trichomycterus rosablanca]|uniref:discoidin, CUB and LCCL domain-containing protein 1 n=1 Tax=Trichomycterus rosablanca TaxID=2290929 RepID=UPI002F3581A4
MFAKRCLYGLFFICVTVYPRTASGKPDDGCGRSDLNSQTGFISSRNYPGSYPNNSRCEWRIRVNASLRIVLGFEELSIQGVDCEADHLKILKEQHGTKYVYWQYCGHSNSDPVLIDQPVYTDASELIVSFRSSSHTSGRGFRLSYDTVDSTDLLSCTSKGTHFSQSPYRKFCPAGCGGAAGDVAGDVLQGYRDTSVLCKAAVHAGIILDQFGGPVTVEKQRGLRYYEPVQANGIQSKSGSLSESLFKFVTSDCSRQTFLQPVSVSSSWERNASGGSRDDASVSLVHSVSPTGTWATELKPWLQLDLGEKKRITGILTKGSASRESFVKSYKISYKEKSRWRTYTQYNSTEDTIFAGNVDSLYQTRNTFRPAITARYIRVLPQQWHRGIGLTAELLGCPYVRSSAVNATSQVTQEAPPSQPKEEEEEITEHVPSQADLVKLVAIVVSAVLCVALLLLLGICVFKALQKKKSKEDMYDPADPTGSGCWKQVKHPSARQQSTEFTFSYSSEKDPLPKIDLVTSTIADYQQPLMLGVGTVSRKGSTFRPIDTDAEDDPCDPTAHYDYLHTANQYALPLTNQEPEYATPIVERHVFRKDGFLPDPSYSVPGAVLGKSSSFKGLDGCTYPRVVPGAYSTPQTGRNGPRVSEGRRPDRPDHSEGVYDSPKNRTPAPLQNGSRSEYQRPKVKVKGPEGHGLSGTGNIPRCEAVM